MLDSFNELQKGGSAFIPYVQGPMSSNGQDWNDQNPGFYPDGGPSGSLLIQSSQRAPNNTNPEMLISLGKRALTLLVCNESYLVMHLMNLII